MKLYDSAGRFLSKTKISISGDLLIIHKRGESAGAKKLDNVSRETVRKFSASSAARMRKYLRETRCEYRTLITLTYPDGHGKDGEQCKRHLKNFIQSIRRDGYGRSTATKDKSGYFWAMEFQQSGKVHYHIIVTDYISKQWVAHRWVDIVNPIGKETRQKMLAASTRVEALKLGRRGIGAYFAKYASKTYQKVIPDNFGWSGRFWGYGGYSERLSAATTIRQGLAMIEDTMEPIKSAFEVLKQNIAEGKAKKIVIDNGIHDDYLEIWRLDDRNEATRLYALISRAEWLKKIKVLEEICRYRVCA